MKTARKISRNELAEMIAIDRAEYEIEYADREDGWQPLLPFVKDAAITIAKRSERGVWGIQVTRSEHGASVYARIDWAQMARMVKRQVPTWKDTIRRMAAKP